MSETRAYPPIINVTAPTAAEFPPSYVDGALGTARDTDTVYIYDAVTATWVVASAGAVLTPASVSDTATIDLSVALGVLTADIVGGSVGATQLADGGVTNAKVATGIDAAKLADGTVSDTELQFINSLSSNAQTQINGKQATGDYITSLTGEATASGPGAAAVTLTNASVIGKVITGYVSGAGTVAATDTILQAIQKLNGNDAAFQPTGNYITALTGDVAASGPGSAAATLATVNAGVGAFGSASQSAQFTVNGKGLITASANVTITPVAIGAQPVDAFLTSIAALTGSGFVMASATDTGIMRSLAVSGNTSAISVTNPAGVAGDPTITYADLRTGNATNLSYTAVGQSTASTPVSPADGAASTVTLGGDVYELVIEVGAGSNERTAIKVFAVFGSAAVSATSDPSGLFLPANAGTGIAVTKSASSNVITVRNRMGGTRAIRIQCVNTSITSATAWA